jgi:hypothetical protein
MELLAVGVRPLWRDAQLAVRATFVARSAVQNQAGGVGLLLVCRSLQARGRLFGVVSGQSVVAYYGTQILDVFAAFLGVFAKPINQADAGDRLLCCL